MSEKVKETCLIFFSEIDCCALVCKKTSVRDNDRGFGAKKSICVKANDAAAETKQPTGFDQLTFITSNYFNLPWKLFHTEKVL